MLSLWGTHQHLHMDKIEKKVIHYLYHSNNIVFFVKGSKMVIVSHINTVQDVWNNINIMSQLTSHTYLL